MSWPTIHSTRQRHRTRRDDAFARAGDGILSHVRRGGSAVGFAVLGALVAVIGVALLDFITPADADFGEFYMLPVIVVAWLAGRRAGLAFAALAAVVEFAVDTALRGATSSTELAIATWNGLADIAVLSSIAVITDIVYRERERWRALDSEQKTLLRMLERELPRPLRAADWFARTFEDAFGAGASAGVRAQFATLRHHTQESIFLVTDLLALGRRGSTGASFARAPVDLRTVVLEAVDESLDRSRVLVTVAEDGLQVLADSDRARHAIASVIARLLEHSPHEPVRVLVRSSDTEAAVEINCRTAGLDPEELELPELLVAGNGGRLLLVGSGPRATTVSIYLARALPAAAATSPGSEAAPRT